LRMGLRDALVVDLVELLSADDCHSPASARAWLGLGLGLGGLRL